MGIAPGTTIVRGVELTGLVAWTGSALPNCLAAEEMQRQRIGGPIKEAFAELDDAMAGENAAIGALEAGLDRRRRWRHANPADR
jgi:hypothetical protein